MIFDLSIGIIGAVVVWLLYDLFFSVEARRTRELSRLNTLYDEFNERVAKKQSFTDIERILHSIRWKYQKEEANLLKTFMTKMHEAGYDERLNEDLKNEVYGESKDS